MEGTAAVGFTECVLGIHYYDGVRRRQWLAGELAEIEQELALREERRAELEESIVSKSSYSNIERVAVAGR